MDKCSKTSLLIDSVVSNLEVINCSRVQVQIANQAPTVTIANTDGCQLFLGPAALGLDILTSKSSAVNVLFEESGGSGDFSEKPVPEQLLTKIVDGKLVTTAIIAG